MLRYALVALLALACGACSRQHAPVDVGGLPPCEILQISDLAGQECRLNAADDVLHVRFAPLAEGASSGAVLVDVINERGSVVQTLNEGGVSQYLIPNVQDVDGDGHGDVVIRRDGGSPNAVMAVWIFARERSRYERAGEVSGVEIERTAEGYVAVPARSGAASWNVAFFRLDESGLSELVTIGIEASAVSRDGVVMGAECNVTDAPGLASLGLAFEEAETKFCAEPAAEVFSQ